MPSSTFLNLPAEKQEKLLEAATREFSHRPFNEASINQIIKEAGIPRGSFYMYFTDKEELFGHLMDSYGALLERRMGEMLEQGLKEVKMIGGAKEGDRTLVDCLAPAVRALREAAGAGADLSEALMRAADAGAEGVEATKKMVAKKGRAKFLQEKSLGHQDAGATSMWIVLKAMSDYCAGK